MSKVSKAPRVLQVQRVRWVRRVCRVFRVLRVIPDPREFKVLRGLKEPQVQPETRDQPARGAPDPLDLRVRAQQDLREQEARDLLDRPG